MAYDVTMDTLIDFRKKLLADKIAYGNLRFLFTRLASNNFVDLKKRGINYDNIIIEEDVEEVDLSSEFSSLSQAWDSLDESDKELLQEFYYNEIPLIQIAEKQNKQDATVRKQKQRAIEKLRELFFKCYKEIQ